MDDESQCEQDWGNEDLTTDHFENPADEIIHLVRMNPFDIMTYGHVTGTRHVAS